MNVSMTDSIAAVKASKTKQITSKMEASLTASEMSGAKESSEVLFQLKQEIEEAKYVHQLMVDIQSKLKEAYLRLEE